MFSFIFGFFWGCLDIWIAASHSSNAPRNDTTLMVRIKPHPTDFPPSPNFLDTHPSCRKIPSPLALLPLTSVLSPKWRGRIIIKRTTDSERGKAPHAFTFHVMLNFFQHDVIYNQFAIKPIIQVAR